ncbi:MAG: 2-phosphosulfolactate phosphatase [Rhodanobacteraceae bacterium]
MTSLKAHFLPDLTVPAELAGGVVVVIDVLRATTVITHALAAGAREVVPCLGIDEALKIAAELPGGQAVLGGEREGLKIEGFDLGNSPEEYRPPNVAGKSVVFTTTNGTRAMMACKTARRVLIGAFVNASAVAGALSGEEHIHLLCSGTRGQITREDVLLAGLLAEQLSRQNLSSAQPPPEINDQFLLARDCWQAFLDRSHSAASANLATALRATQGGRNLKTIGLERDIDEAARIDRFSFVPELDLNLWTIRRPTQV